MMNLKIIHGYISVTIRGAIAKVSVAHVIEGHHYFANSTPMNTLEILPTWMHVKEVVASLRQRPCPENLKSNLSISNLIVLILLISPTYSGSNTHCQSKLNLLFSHVNSDLLSEILIMHGRHSDYHHINSKVNIARLA